MKKMLVLGFLACVVSLSGCSTMQQYAAYRMDMLRGAQLMSEGDYRPALEDFIKAAGAMPASPIPMPLPQPQATRWATSRRLRATSRRRPGGTRRATPASASWGTRP